MPKSKKKDKPEASNTTAASAPSIALTKPTTVQSNTFEEKPLKTDNFILPKFDFERQVPLLPEPKISSEEILQRVKAEKETMSEEEWAKKYPTLADKSDENGVTADVAMDYLMEEYGSI